MLDKKVDVCKMLNFTHISRFASPVKQIIKNSSSGGAQGPHPQSDPGVVPAPEGPEEAACGAEGPGLQAPQAEGGERRQPLPAGFCQAAAAAQRQREGPGVLVRASAHLPAEEKTGRGGVLEEEQGAGRGPEGQRGAPEGGHAGTGGAESLSAAEALSGGEGGGGERRTAQGDAKVKYEMDEGRLVKRRPTRDVSPFCRRRWRN